MIVSGKRDRWYHKLSNKQWILLVLVVVFWHKNNVLFYTSWLRNYSPFFKPLYRIDPNPKCGGVASPSSEHFFFYTGNGFFYLKNQILKFRSSGAALNQLWIPSFASLLEPSKSASQKFPWDHKQWRRTGVLQVPWLIVLLSPVHEHYAINHARLLSDRA